MYMMDKNLNESDKYKIKHIKTAFDIPSEPLRIRYKNKYGKVVGDIYNNKEVEAHMDLI